MEKAVKKQVKKGGETEASQLTAVVKALALAYALTLLVFIVYAIILTYTEVSDVHIPMISTMTTAVACVAAGFDSAKGAKSRGFFWGVGTGFGYAIILFCIGFFAGEGFTLSLSKVTTVLVAVSGGGIGGILGINRKK